MRVLYRVFALALGLAVTTGALGCGSGTGPAASRNNPGTGTSTLLVTADIDANDVPNTTAFNTEFVVQLRDAAGSPVSGATVAMGNPVLGTITLVETGVGSGDYTATRSGFPGGDFSLNVTRGTDNVRDVVLGGPSVHAITAPVQNQTVPASQALTVRWTVPSQAQFAEMETRDFGPFTAPDNGTYTFPAAQNPVRADQRVRVFRFNEVTIAGGRPGSRLRVEVRRTVEPVVVQ